jgi:hypothetical protein
MHHFMEFLSCGLVPSGFLKICFLFVLFVVRYFERLLTVGGSLVRRYCEVVFLRLRWFLLFLGGLFAVLLLGGSSVAIGASVVHLRVVLVAVQRCIVPLPLMLCFLVLM